MKQQTQVKTKLDKNDKNPKLTVVTLDFSKCVMADLIGPATDTLVINLQAGWRRAKSIPQKIEVDVKDMISRMGSRSSAPLTAEGILAVSSSMSTAEVNALIEKMRAEAKARDDAEKAAAKTEKSAEKKTGKGGKAGKDGDGQGDQPSV